MNIRNRLLGLVLIVRGSIPTWLLVRAEIPRTAKYLMLGAVSGVSGPLVAPLSLRRRS